MTIRVAFRMVTPRTWTGGLNYLLNICRVMRIHLPQYEPIFFAPQDISPHIRTAIVTAVGQEPLPLRERTHGDDALALFGCNEREAVAAFASAGIDLVFESTGFYGWRPPFSVLSWLPDFQHRRLPNFFSYRNWLVREMRYRALLSSRKHILLSSVDARDDLAHFYGEDGKFVHIAPFAICMDHVPNFEEGEGVRCRYGLPERFIYFPSQLWAHKNHKLLVEALGLLGDRAPTVVITGGGDHRSPQLQSQLEARIAQLGVADKVRLLGQLSYAEVLALNARADALLNPSLFEGWSSTVEEAKLLFTPLILSNLSVHREQAGASAEYFDPRDAADCARALSIEIPRREPVDSGRVQATNVEAQRKFAQNLDFALRAVLDDGER